MTATSDTTDQTRADEDLIRVLLVDDHPTVRSGLRAILTADPVIEVVGEEGSAQAAAAAIPRLTPDVVLLDLGLPDTRGVDTVTTVVNANPETKVLVLSGSAAGDIVRDTVAAGAHGFLLKTAASLALLDAIKAVHGGRRVVDPELVAELVNEPRAGLTRREVEVLHAVADGLTNRQVATRLGVAEETVKTHLSRAMAKLDAHDRTHAVAILLRKGLLA